MKLSIIITLIFSFVSLPSFARMDQEDVIRNEVRSILDSHDPKATFRLKVNTYSSSGSKKSAIPFAPNSGSSISGRSYIGKIQATIITSNSAKVTEAKKLIEAYLNSYSKNVTVEVVDVESAVNAQQETTKESWWSSLFDLSAPWVVAITIGFSLLFVALVVLISSQRSTNAISSLESTVAGIGQSVMRSNTASQQEDKAQSKVLDSEGVAEFKRYVEGLKPESLKEMMGDCYWTDNHQVASFLWNSLWASHRSELTNASPWLSEYAEFLLTQTPKFDQRLYSPYFLKPLSLSHLDQTAVLSEVRNDGQVYNLVSELRSEHLELTGDERIDLEISRGQAVKDEAREKVHQKLSRLPKSQPKSFASGKIIPIASVEDEMSLLQRDDLSLQVKSRIPTLSWLEHMDQQELTEKLRMFSAQDLANAWIGPEDVLSKLEQLVPEKKLKLLKSYLEKVDQPSRNHPVFRELHQLGVNALLKSSEQEHHDHEQDQQTDAA